MVGGLVLDASVLVQFAAERLYPHALVWAGLDENVVLAVPSIAITVAKIRTPPAQHDLLRVLLNLPHVVVEPMTPDHDVPDGYSSPNHSLDHALARHVVQCAQRRGWTIVTDSPRRLLSLDPSLSVDELP
jgi:hypothetical protein